MKRTANARWEGGLKDGKGVLTTGSGVLSDTKYSFGTRFEDTPGTNPEELVAAAHAGCFSMAVSALLGRGGITVESVATKATLNMEMKEIGPTITGIHLAVTIKAPGADPAVLKKTAEDAKTGCVISRVLNTEITLDVSIS